MASEEFTKKVQKWVEIDNEIEAHNQAIKKLRENKNKVSVDVMTHMQSNNIPGINITGGKIKMSEKTSQVSLSYKLLENCLVKFFHQHGNPSAETFAKNIVEFTRNERKKEDKKTVTLERTHPKNNNDA